MLRYNNPESIAPWFALPEPSHSKDVAIIGAGLAGCACAHVLAQQGYHITLYEQHDAIATEASGNPYGILMPHLTADHNLVDQFYSHGFQVTREYIHNLNAQTPIDHQFHGVIHLATEARIAKRFAGIAKRRDIDSATGHPISAKIASQLSNVPCRHDGFFFPTAGIVNPNQFCQALIHTAANTKIHYNHTITQLQLHDHQWHLIDQQDKAHQHHHVIVANAHAATALSQCRDYPIRRVPGQLTYLPSTQTSQQLKRPICHEGYLLPALHHQHVLGATYRHHSNDQTLTTEDHQYNLKTLTRALPQFTSKLEIADLKGRVACRANTPDHLPLIGPIANKSQFDQAYDRIQHGGTLTRTRYPKAEYYPNLYICAGFGSRGLAAALLAAEMLSATITQTPLPVNHRVYHAIHPSRFWLRSLKRCTKLR